MKQYVWLVYKTGELLILHTKGDIVYSPSIGIRFECLGEL